MSLWDMVCKTDPDFTKQSEQKGGFTSINPYYQIREATRLWGPYGNNWGLEDVEIKMNSDLGMVLLNAKFFCPETRFTIYNAIEPISAKGRRDADFLKKLETDTLTKALSKLGFNADVFMSQFDDLNYVAERAAESQLEKTENKEKVLERRYNEIKQNVHNTIHTFAQCPTVATVESIKQKAKAKTQRELAAYRFRPDQFDSMLDEAAAKRIADLQLGNAQ